MEGVVRWPQEYEEKYRRCGYWEDVTLGEHFDHWAEMYADRPALAYEGRDISYREMEEQVNRIAYRMADLGVRTYDRVILQLFNVPELVYVLYACWKIGAIPVCTLPSHRSSEIGFLGRETEAKVHVIPAGEVKGFDYEEFAERMRHEVPTLKLVFTLGEPLRAGMVPLLGALNSYLSPNVARKALAAFRPDPSEPAVFQLSGGTTGTPKVIPRTHNDYYYNAKCIARALELRGDERLLTPIPLTHNGPLLNSLLCAHVVGACCVLTTSFAPESIMRAISLNRTTIMGAPVVLMHRLLDVPPEVRAKYDLSSVKLIWWSGTIAPDDQARLRELFHGCDIGQNYGMAEGLICMTRRSDPLETKMFTLGRPISEADEVVIVDINTGNQVPVGELGELWCRGPYTIRGYYKASERNRVAFSTDGYYKTGDLLKKDKHGNYVWGGRIKDCISRGGEKINAEEVEAAIRRFDKVRDVAVVPVPDRMMEERVCAFVVPQPGQSITLDELAEFLLREVGLAKFKVPERLEIADELPLTGLGKTVDKKALREIIAAKAKGRGDCLTVGTTGRP